MNYLKDALPRIPCLAVLFILCGTMSSLAQGPACEATIAKIPQAIGPGVLGSMGLGASDLTEAKKIGSVSAKLLRLVVPLADKQYVLLYESDVGYAPDAQIFIVRSGHIDIQFGMDSLPLKPEQDLDLKWRKSFRAFEYARACTNTAEFVYLSFESGNAGGALIAIVQTKGLTKVVPLGDVTQGRLLISRTNPSVVEMWSVARKDFGLCTGCPNHYTVTTVDLSSGSRFVKSEKATKETYDGDEFQNHPLDFGGLGESRERTPISEGK